MSQNFGRRFVNWLKGRVGLQTNVLRPVPEYSMNPFYWLGALTAMAFGLQALTGLLMMIYYVPSTDQAYSSTLFIIKNVPLGWLIETVHLYGAYSMILLAFLHLFRGYFVSVQKRPREMMWVVGMLMGLLVLGMGLTGYLLPWTVVSKSASDVSIGMLGFLPAQIGNIITFLIAGTGSSAAELTRFFDLHIVVLPAGLLSLLVLKMYMFEAHGASKPPAWEDGREPPGVEKQREYPWWPSVYLYFAMIGSVFIAAILLASALFPIVLAPEFSPAAASAYVPQPDWYFLWMYQILKFAPFEGQGIFYALGGVTVLALFLVLLPFIDRGRHRDPWSRPLYVMLGMIIIAELVTLTVWGYYTPGAIIPGAQAIMVTGGVFVAMCLVTAFAFRLHNGRFGIGLPFKGPFRALGLPFANLRFTGAFLVPLVVGSVCFANVVGSLTLGAAAGSYVVVNIVVLIVSFYAMARMMRRLTIRNRLER
ncbi:MAG TPA: cytochrome bc complex cytochrome b subunit [Nitrososphaerales archaeon]|nr:cytochrome bc complex cytochrome b subunit [Nitrososphaerales archaeon]